MNAYTANTKEKRRAVLLDLAVRPSRLEEELQSSLNTPNVPSLPGATLMHREWRANLVRALIELAEDVAGDVELSNRLDSSLSLAASR